jgi:hypothetical protein
VISNQKGKCENEMRKRRKEIMADNEEKKKGKIKTIKRGKGTKGRKKRKE